MSSISVQLLIVFGVVLGASSAWGAAEPVAWWDFEETPAGTAATPVRDIGNGGLDVNEPEC